MSKENVDAWTRIIAAYNRGDKAGFLAEQHPDCETIPIRDWPDQGPYVGAAQRDFYMEAEDVWRSERPPIEDMEIVDAGDRLFVRLSRMARIRGSEEPMDFTLYGAATFREGKLARVQWFLEREEALEAAGLRE